MPTKTLSVAFMIAAFMLALFAGHAAAKVYPVRKSPVKLRQLPLHGTRLRAV